MYKEIYTIIGNVQKKTKCQETIHLIKVELDDVSGRQW